MESGQIEGIRNYPPRRAGSRRTLGDYRGIRFTRVSRAAARTASPWASRACAPARWPSPRGRSRTSTRRPRDAPDAKRSGRLSEANPVGAARGRAGDAVEPVVVVRVWAHILLVSPSARLGCDSRVIAIHYGV